MRCERLGALMRSRCARWTLGHENAFSRRQTMYGGSRAPGTALSRARQTVVSEKWDEHPILLAPLWAVCSVANSRGGPAIFGMLQKPDRLGRAGCATLDSRGSCGQEKRS